jgi:hypothetical protein
MRGVGGKLAMSPLRKYFDERRGGVYCCEDIHGFPNEFASYVHRLAHRLKHSANIEEHADDNERSLAGSIRSW